MAKRKKFGIRARPNKSSNYFARGRRRDGSRYEYSLPISIEPPQETPTELRKQKREELKCQAEEASEVLFRKEWGLITDEECEARLKGISKRVTKRESKVTVAYFFVAWVWEHVLRGKPHPTRAATIARVVFSFLSYIGPLAAQTVHDLRAAFCETFILERRMGECSQGVANDEVLLFKSICKDIKEITGLDLAAGLELEVVVTQERLIFAYDEMVRICGATRIMKSNARDWTTFLLILLYTEMRPEDAAIVQRKDVDLEAGLIRFRAQKLEAYGRDLPRKPMHDELWKYLRAMLADLVLSPDAFLCPSIAGKLGDNLNKDFLKILKAAEVDPCKGLAKHRQIEWSGKSLYSVRHTGNTWLAAEGATDKEQKLELGDSTTQALEHYQHHDNPIMLSAEKRRINKMPSVLRPNALATGANTAPPPQPAGMSSKPLCEPQGLAGRRRLINKMPHLNVSWKNS